MREGDASVIGESPFLNTTSEYEQDIPKQHTWQFRLKKVILNKPDYCPSSICSDEK